MKNVRLIATALFLSGACFLQAQEEIAIKAGCNYEGEETNTEYYAFPASNEATRIMKEILEAAGGLSANRFVLRESNVKNAVATVDNGQRVILYSVTFLEQFKADAKTKWAAYSVLAHEIGHHLNGHDFNEKDPKKRKTMELEADKFSGGVLRTLGANLNEVRAGIESMTLPGETNTHPKKDARVAAVANGWKRQDELLNGNKPETSSTPVLTPPSPGKAQPSGSEPARTNNQPVYTQPVYPQTAAINIAYTGDMYGCLLTLAIGVGDNVFNPTGSWFTAYNIPTGVQNYEIAGTIACTALGSCYAAGQGTLNIVPGGVYDVVWQNVAYGTCSVQLVPRN